MTSISGVVFGWYRFEGRLNISTESGLLALMLVPRFNFTEERINVNSISITSVSGEIDVYALWQYWPQQPLDHHTYAHSISRAIKVDVLHGSNTHISSMAGDVLAYIQPFGKECSTDPSHVFTLAHSGKLLVYFCNVERPLGIFYDPLLNTASEHFVSDGEMVVRYPYSWYGEMRAMVVEGSIDFDGSSIDSVERGDRFVNAKRGSGANSLMKAVLEHGNMDVILGLSDWPPASWR